MTTTPLTDQQLADTSRLAEAARRALESLDIFIAESTDPGTEALGAQYCLRQELTRHSMTGEPPKAVDAVLTHELRKAIASAFAREDAHHWGYDHGFCSEYGTDPETDAFVDIALAVVQPEVDRLRAELAQHRDQVLTEAAAERPMSSLIGAAALRHASNQAWEGAGAGDIPREAQRAVAAWLSRLASEVEGRARTVAACTVQAPR